MEIPACPTTAAPPPKGRVRGVTSPPKSLRRRLVHWKVHGRVLPETPSLKAGVRWLPILGDAAVRRTVPDPIRRAALASYRRPAGLGRSTCEARPLCVGAPSGDELRALKHVSLRALASRIGRDDVSVSLTARELTRRSRPKAASLSNRVRVRAVWKRPVAWALMRGRGPRRRPSDGERRSTTVRLVRRRSASPAGRGPLSTASRPGGTTSPRAPRGTT